MSIKLFSHFEPVPKVKAASLKLTVNKITKVQTIKFRDRLQLF